MKKIFFFLLLSTQIQAAPLSENLFLNDKSGFEVSDDQVTSLENSVKDLIELNSNVVEGSLRSSSTPAGPKWSAAGYVTSIGVTSAGKMGILGFKGAAMAEIYWRKKQASLSARNQSWEMDAQEIPLSDLSDSGINESLEHLMAIIKGSKKVENPESAREDLRQKLTEFADLVKGTHADHSKPWYLAGIRLDLAVSGSGQITPVLTLGAALNFRVVWVPVKAKVAPRSALNDTQTELSHMTEDLTQILSEIPDNQALESRGLKLNQIRFGLGVTAAGKVFFGKAEGSLVFSVLMNKNPKYVAPPVPLQARLNNSALPFKNDSVLEKMDWKLFKKGIEKSLKLSRSFIKKNVDEEAEKKKKWEITTIKTSYSMNLSKGVGLVTIGDVAQLQMTYKK